jgi:hypothetical protein
VLLNYRSKIMAKVYGERWEVLRSLATGGQAEVFLVRDIKGEYSGELVLKRVLNSKRHPRFRSEVAAIKRLVHPSIIRLIDHSALTDDDSPPERQFIVMPYASYGDLSGRVALYKNNPDSVILVAKSLASALQAAHAAGIVHRDVKPPNVLFPTAGHDVWLGDFGICLIRDLDRRTEDAEVVGPIQFMAPELEDGGQLDVSPAVDVYSLGKVIYFMLSGGVVLPRERLHESEYASIFATGERQRLFGMLLSRMICSLPRRLQTMDEVLVQLSRIESWERDARLLPIHPKTLSAIEALQKRALDAERQKDESATVRARREAALAATQSAALGWLRAELEKMAALIGDGHGLSAGVRDVASNENDCPRLNRLLAGAAVELWFRNRHETFQCEHLLRFSFCTEFKATVRTFVGHQSPMADITEEPAETNVAIIPTYGRKMEGATPRRAPDWQFFTADGRLYRPSAGKAQQPIGRGMRRITLPQQPQGEKIQAIRFSTAQWPDVAGSFSEFFQTVADLFVQAVAEGNARPLG